MPHRGRQFAVAAPGQRLVALPEGMTPQQFVDLRTRLFALYDALLPKFAASLAAPAPEIRAQAQEFKALFLKLREEPLAPYYEGSGGEFFTWIDAMGR